MFPFTPRYSVLLYPGPRRELTSTESLGNCPDVLALPEYGVTYNCESQLAVSFSAGSSITGVQQEAGRELRLLTSLAGLLGLC